MKHLFPQKKTPQSTIILWVQKNSTRVLLFVTVLVLVVTYGYYIPLIRQTSVPTISKEYPLLNPALGILGKENMIVDFQKLRDSLTSTYEKRDDYLVSIYFEFLPTGANISINKDEKIWPASLIKIPVAMAALKKVENGKWKLDNELVIMDEDKDDAYGELYKEQTGTTHTVEEFLKESLINSDNTAHFVLLRNIDNKELEDVYVHLGLDDVIDALKKSPKKDAEDDNRITAKRYTIFFRSLYNATFLSPLYSQMFLGILGHAPKELLSKGLPENIQFVHKTGVRVDEAVRADSGIVYVPGRPYLITVMVQQKDKKVINEEKVNAIFEDISKQIYTYVSNPH